MQIKIVEAQCPPVSDVLPLVLCSTETKKRVRGARPWMAKREKPCPGSREQTSGCVSRKSLVRGHGSHDYCDIVATWMIRPKLVFCSTNEAIAAYIVLNEEYWQLIILNPG
ncbi:hypothetical protein TNCV_1271251 [Trichonephila clavipes]|nr:hypothetical protein TNCV_1271251 [Trichonephila clavipes]